MIDLQKKHNSQNLFAFLAQNVHDEQQFDKIQCPFDCNCHLFHLGRLAGLHPEGGAWPDLLDSEDFPEENFGWRFP